MATLLMMALPDESQGLFESHGITPNYCGIGLIKAAYMTQQLILKKKPTRVLNLGTAGSHTFKQGQLVECTSFVYRQPANFQGIGQKKITTSPITNLTQAVCGSADFIENSEPLTKCDVMDMEAYAMAFVCTQLQIPFHSVKFISDYSDKNLLQDWKKNLRQGAEKLLMIYREIENENTQR